jgi:hypothetical protein
MPRQTNQKSIIFPDGFKFGVDTGDGFEDVGILSGGATATINWDEFYLDGGNYEAVVDKAINPTVALSPSAVWNWNPTVINKLMLGFMSQSDAISPSAGDNLVFSGTSSQFTLTRASLRLIHFTDSVTETLLESDITALSTDTVNDYITVPKTTFTGALDWSTDIDGYVEIDGMTEVHVSDKNVASSQGQFYTDATNLYFIVATGTYIDLAAAKTGIAGTDVKAYTDVDWAFTLYNAKVDAGASMNFKGLNEDGVNEYTVSFTGRPDPAQSYRLFKFFRA